MASDIDIYHAATLLLDRYGTGALVEVARHAFALRDCGDVGGYRVWKRIVVVIGTIDEPRRARSSSQMSVPSGNKNGGADLVPR